MIFGHFRSHHYFARKFPRRTLQFELCNGFGNQVISLVSAIIIAAESKRHILMPRFVLNGIQMGVAEISSRQPKSVSLDQVIDVQRLQKAHSNIPPFILSNDVPSDPLPKYFTSPIDENFIKQSNSKEQIHIGCPAFRLDKSLIEKHKDLALATLTAISPHQKYLGLHNYQLITATIPGKYNVLHFRAEDDWIQHCSAWEGIPDGIIRNNCFNNTLDVGYAMRSRGWNPRVPLIVLTDRNKLSPEMMRHLTASLERWGFLSWFFSGRLETSSIMLDREERAMIDFFCALSAENFIGNSVSSFSALVIAIRKETGRSASYYNGGNIPLESFFPLYRLPWLTTANEDMDYEYFNMLKTAIVSGMQIGLKPYVLFEGSKDSEVFLWLNNRKVSIIQHKLSISNELLDIVKENREEHAKTSHLYDTDEAVLGTWQRIDIPIIKELAEHEFVLFTDCDIYFRSRLYLTDFGLPLPKFLAMASEGDDIFPYNAGVILFNMVSMRESFHGFVNFILEHRRGLYYGPNYGPGDQGAYNRYYAQTLKPNKLSQDFNAKPYHSFNAHAKIVHFHGPKVQDYEMYIRTGSCRFGDMCKHGIAKGSACQYAQELLRWNLEWESLRSLNELCRS